MQLVDTILEALQRSIVRSNYNTGHMMGVEEDQPGAKRQRVRLDRDTEVEVEWSESAPAGNHDQGENAQVGGKQLQQQHRKGTVTNRTRRVR